MEWHLLGCYVRSQHRNWPILLVLFRQAQACGALSFPWRKQFLVLTATKIAMVFATTFIIPSLANQNYYPIHLHTECASLPNLPTVFNTQSHTEILVSADPTPSYRYYTRHQQQVHRCTPGSMFFLFFVISQCLVFSSSCLLKCCHGNLSERHFFARCVSTRDTCST